MRATLEAGDRGRKAAPGATRAQNIGSDTASQLTLLEFVLDRLPPAPVRVLDVGCGRGDLALALVDSGYDVLGIDPEAPEGPIFVPVKLENFDTTDRFDFVVASRSLHHIEDLAAALAKIRALLGPGGVLIVNEFAWDRVDEPTADWYYGQRDILAAVRGGPGEPKTEPPLARWRSEHGDLNRHADMRPALDKEFVETHFSWEPYLHEELGSVVSETLERALIEADAIRPVGFRFVGTPC